MRKETAARHLGLMAPALMALAQAPATQKAMVAAPYHSPEGVAAAVIQTTPGERSPALEIDSGPGYVIVRQRGPHSRAVIMQGVAPVEEK